jgi:hypothetical protein
VFNAAGIDCYCDLRQTGTQPPHRLYPLRAL